MNPEPNIPPVIDVKGLTKRFGRFTAVDNAAMNIDGGLVRDRFFLATGVDTTNRDSKLNTMLERPAAPAAQVPQDLP